MGDDEVRLSSWQQTSAALAIHPRTAKQPVTVLRRYLLERSANGEFSKFMKKMSSQKG